MSKIDVFLLAKYIIYYCNLRNFKLNNYTLQKILYLLEIEALRKGFSLFDEEFYAWQIGPVIPDLYYKYCGFGANQLVTLEKVVEIDFEMETFIDNEIKKYVNKPFYELYDLISQPNDAWDLIYNHKAPYLPIPKSLMREKGITY